MFWRRKVKQETRGETGTFQISLMSSACPFHSVISGKSTEEHSLLKTRPTLHPPVEVLVNLFTTTEQKRRCDRSGFVFNLVVFLYLLELQSHRSRVFHATADSKYLQLSRFLLTQSKHKYHLDFSQYCAIAISLDIKALKRQAKKNQTHGIFHLYAESHPEALWS